MSEAHLGVLLVMMKHLFRSGEDAESEKYSCVTHCDAKQAQIKDEPMLTIGGYGEEVDSALNSDAAWPINPEFEEL